MKQYIQSVSSCFECPNYDRKFAMDHAGCLALDRVFTLNEEYIIHGIHENPTKSIIDDCPLDDY